MILKVLCVEELWPSPSQSRGPEWPPVIDNILVFMQSFLPRIMNCLDPARHMQLGRELALEVENSCVLDVFAQCLKHWFFHLQSEANNTLQGSYEA